MIDHHIQIYTCESGALARLVIPTDATEDDLRGIAEMVDVVLKRHYKVQEKEQEEER